MHRRIVVDLHALKFEGKFKELLLHGFVTASLSKVSEPCKHSGGIKQLLGVRAEALNTRYRAADARICTARRRHRPSPPGGSLAQRDPIYRERERYTCIYWYVMLCCAIVYYRRSTVVSTARPSLPPSWPVSGRTCSWPRPVVSSTRSRQL